MKTQSNITIILPLIIILLSACNTKINSQFNKYNIALDSIISGYDSKDIDTYTKTQYRIISSNNIYNEIQEDTLLSPQEKENLIDRLSNAALAWHESSGNTFTKIVFTINDNNIMKSIEISYINNHDIDSISILQIHMPEEVKDIQVTLADWKQDSIYNEYHLNTTSLEHGVFISRLGTKAQKELGGRDMIFIYEYIQEIDSCYIAGSIPLRILQKQLNTN